MGISWISRGQGTFKNLVTNSRSVSVCLIFPEISGVFKHPKHPPSLGLGRDNAKRLVRQIGNKSIVAKVVAACCNDGVPEFDANPAIPGRLNWYEACLLLTESEEK